MLLKKLLKLLHFKIIQVIIGIILVSFAAYGALAILIMITNEIKPTIVLISPRLIYLTVLIPNIGVVIIAMLDKTKKLYLLTTFVCLILFAGITITLYFCYLYITCLHTNVI